MLFGIALLSYTREECQSNMEAQMVMIRLHAVAIQRPTFIRRLWMGATC